MAVIGRIGTQVYPLVDMIGRGGEASVYRHPADPSLAVRIYKNPADVDVDRIQEMIGAEPQPQIENGFPCFSWPIGIVTDPKTGHMIGTVIRYAPEAVPLSQVMIPGYRIPEISEAWLIQVARSLAYRVYTAEFHGYMVVDCNPDNFLVNRQGIVCAVDCESYQFKSKAGQQYQCVVGVPEYTAPELLTAPSRMLGDKFSTAWSVMMLVHQVLRDGEHSFNSANTTPPLEERIVQGLWPDSGKFVAYPPPPGARPFSNLPSEFQELCRRTFADGHSNPSARPTLCEIVQVLDKLKTADVSISRTAWAKQLPQTSTGTQAHKRQPLVRPRIREVAAACVVCAAAAGLMTMASMDQTAPPVLHHEVAEGDIATTQAPDESLPTPRMWRELRDLP
jgi:DNA-binding helix-hairpin-helix protein with protein kinase domain